MHKYNGKIDGALFLLQSTAHRNYQGAGEFAVERIIAWLKEDLQQLKEGLAEYKLEREEDNE